MNPLTVVLSSLLLLIPLVISGSSSRDPNLLPKATDSAEEFDQYLNDPNKLGGHSYGSVPSSFDARTKWARCPSVSKVPDQGCCDASFAFVPTAVMTDRTCIVNNRTDVVYSAYDAITCCAACVLYSWDKCRGGQPEEVWKYWVNSGIATEDCLGYNLGRNCNQQSCPSQCTGMSSKSVTGDRRRGQMYYKVNPTVGDIQQEIMNNGPVEASFQMYLDFVTFSGNGVYAHRSGPYLRQHSVKIVGWGTQGGTDYWLVGNTFGSAWVDGGFAKFLRGEDHLGIESNVRAAMPSQ